MTGVEVHMVAIARALSRASGIEVDVETLTTVVLLCGVGLVVVLLLAEGVTVLGVTPDYNAWDIMGWV
jgi:hypothetical protein